MPLAIGLSLYRDFRNRKKNPENPGHSELINSPFKRGEEIPQVTHRMKELEKAVPWLKREKEWVWIKGGPPDYETEARVQD